MVDLLLAFQSFAMLVSLLMETGALIAPKASHLRAALLLSALQSLAMLVSFLMEVSALIALQTLFSPTMDPLLPSASSVRTEPLLGLDPPRAFL